MTFEETYPRYPFSDLVRLGVSVAKAVPRARIWIRTRCEQQLGLPTLPAASAV